MKISILYIGDIVGEPGRDAVKELLPGLIAELDPDVVLANAENATHGKGLKPSHYEELIRAGIDGISLGDHAWDQPEISQLLEDSRTVIARPANTPGAPGRPFVDLTVKGNRLRLINLLGRVFMRSQVDSPFMVFDALVAEHPKPDVVVVDFHAEATSEKRMFAEYASGRAQLVVGTHTHVPTADAQILNEKTAFITDLGMTGPTDSSLGAEKSESLKGFLTGLPWRYSLASGQCELGAVFATIDCETGTALDIRHIRRFTAK